MGWPRRVLIVALVACGAGESPTTTPPAPRARTAFDEGFVFFLAPNPIDGASPSLDETPFASVSVPHTWNVKAPPFVTSDNAWYRKHFTVPASAAGRRFFVTFEGVGTVADVSVNGVAVGEHRGAYTGFTFDVTSALVFGRDNVLAVRVDNTDAGTSDCLPAQALARNYFKPYGGIYRKVWLTETDALHVDPTELGASGVRVVVTNVSPSSADISLRVLVKNDGDAPAPAHVEASIGENANVALVLAGDATIPPRTALPITLAGALASPALWSVRAARLYDARVRVSVGGVVHDEVTERFGVRKFEKRADGLYLNDAPIVLHGISKHQESERSLAAMSDDELHADWDGLDALGVNFVRLVHYPHAQLEYAEADARGLLVWAENGHATPWPGTDTGERITREMVRQLENHPSIVFFSAGNESAPDGDATSHDTIVRYAKAIRDEDPTRLVAYANNTSFSDPAVDVIANNSYPGWYGGDAWDFEALASARYFSETGGRSVVTQHTDYADAHLVLGAFEPEEYLQSLAESRFHVAFRTRADQISMFTWWVYRDFLLDGRPKGVNDSGVVSFDGALQKDVLHLYASFLQTAPRVHVASKAYFVRRARPDNGIKAYANVPTLNLTIDGVDQGTRANGAYQQSNGRNVDDVFFWSAPLHEGMNDVLVSDGAGHDDRAAIYFAATTAPPPDDGKRLVQSLASTNPAAPAYFYDAPIAQDFPVFYDLDGTADNSFAEIPSLLAGARPIATKRTSKPENQTTLSFTIDPAATSATVYVVVTVGGAAPSGFTDTHVGGVWRDDGMNRVPFAIYALAVAGGASVVVPPIAADYVVLVKSP